MRRGRPDDVGVIKYGQAESSKHGVAKDMSTPQQRLLGYYGDDFTGSTDVLEALFQTGLKSVLFLQPPSLERLQTRFADAACFGVAGVGRSLSPGEMELELRPVLELMRRAGVLVAHYKVCSTFDSSPLIGNIGRAAEIGREVFAAAGGWIPLLVGVPYLRRFTVFGHHFAGTGAGTETAIHRLDRHPTMSQHPVTPMAESDLRLHLAQQTAMRSALFNILEQEGTVAEMSARLGSLVEREQAELVLFDVLDNDRLHAVGKLLWQEALRRGTLYAIGSSGIEYALAAPLAAGGGRGFSSSFATSSTSPKKPYERSRVDRLLVVSGSCSPVTERQIACALAAGYVGIRASIADLVDPERRMHAQERLRSEALEAFEQGRSVILYSASGASDPMIEAGRAALREQGLQPEDSSAVLGACFGAVAKRLIEEAGITRLLIAGGDTSGYVTRELGIYAIECLAALEPGAPLCKAYSHNPHFDGLELVLKGGQVGGDHFFERVAAGG